MKGAWRACTPAATTLSFQSVMTSACAVTDNPMSKHIMKLMRVIEPIISSFQPLSRGCQNRTSHRTIFSSRAVQCTVLQNGMHASAVKLWCYFGDIFVLLSVSTAEGFGLLPASTHGEKTGPCAMC